MTLLEQVASRLGSEAVPHAIIGAAALAAAGISRSTYDVDLLTTDRRNPRRRLLEPAADRRHLDRGAPWRPRRSARRRRAAPCRRQAARRPRRRTPRLAGARGRRPAPAWARRQSLSRAIWCCSRLCGRAPWTFGISASSWPFRTRRPSPRRSRPSSPACPRRCGSAGWKPGADERRSSSPDDAWPLSRGEAPRLARAYARLRDEPRTPPRARRAAPALRAGGDPLPPPPPRPRRSTNTSARTARSRRSASPSPCAATAGTSTPPGRPAPARRRCCAASSRARRRAGRAPPTGATSTTSATAAAARARAARRPGRRPRGRPRAHRGGAALRPSRGLRGGGAPEPQAAARPPGSPSSARRPSPRCRNGRAGAASRSCAPNRGRFAPSRDGAMLEPDQVRALPAEEPRRRHGAARHAGRPPRSSPHPRPGEGAPRRGPRLDRRPPPGSPAGCSARSPRAMPASPRILEYLAEVEADVVERAGEILSSPENGLEAAVRPRCATAPVDGPFRRYQVNVLVDAPGRPARRWSSRTTRPTPT